MDVTDHDLAMVSRRVRSHQRRVRFATFSSVLVGMAGWLGSLALVFVAPEEIIPRGGAMWWTLAIGVAGAIAVNRLLSPKDDLADLE